MTTESPRTKSRVSIIVAIAKNRVIGREDHLPWHISEDLKRFKQLTMGHYIVMGRKTWDSIGRLLPGRQHVIVSRQPGFSVEGATVVDSMESAIAACGGDSEIFIIGGGEIYRLALPSADRIYATEIDGDFEGDVHFPTLDRAIWKETLRDSRCDENTSMRYSFVTFDRDTPRNQSRPAAAPGEGSL